MTHMDDLKRSIANDTMCIGMSNNNYGAVDNWDAECNNTSHAERSDIFHNLAFHRVQSVYTLLRRRESVSIPLARHESFQNFPRVDSFFINQDECLTMREFKPEEKAEKVTVSKQAPLSSISTREKPSQDRKGGTILAGWSVINLIQGVGILGVPYAIQQGGWASLFCLFLVAWMCCYTGKLLVDCMYETSPKTGIRHRLRVNYVEVGEACFGKTGEKLVGIVQTTEMMGASVLYLVLLGTVWTDLLGKQSGLGIPEWAAINCLLTLPSLFITRMSILSWLSMVSVFALMSSLFAIIAFSVTQYSVWTLANIPTFDPKKFPIGFAIIVFSYCAHAIFPSVEGSMKKPEKFGKMMNCSFVLASCVKCTMGIAVVLTYGINTQQVCTVNFSEYQFVSIPVGILVIISVLLAIPLCMFVVSSLFDDIFLRHFPHLQPQSGYHWVWLLISRPLLINVALFLGIIVPHFALLMGIVGSVTGTSLCFVFPCVFHIKLRWKGMPLSEKVIDILVIAFGGLAGILGLWFSGEAVAKSFKL